ncbi:GlsB/YeaQ/YmgE family stress response membrane protein [Loktanella sp. M215]|uniref:GlsB/YeaQ/YmgE family stress response membrane protein n=1 Tax=Loktanella sp. M215 TaxID=2675431 RepID=UPI001F40427F|nr:GlsB/YeaQ/YmgE family stress response membrane protein [Loktanella sp. M215]MCF7701398.1 GlsB/YeaQ/YmgE family stress response membrane protein [Loktanella sp. M215]
MDTFLQVVGWGAISLLAVIGLVAGLIAAVITGGNKGAYIVAGIIGAVALPFVLALLGVTAAIGAGLLAILVIGAVGAVVLVVLIKALTGRSDDRPRR